MQAEAKDSTQHSSIFRQRSHFFISLAHNSQAMQLLGVGCGSYVSMQGERRGSLCDLRGGRSAPVTSTLSAGMWAQSFPIMILPASTPPDKWVWVTWGCRGRELEMLVSLTSKPLIHCNVMQRLIVELCNVLMLLPLTSVNNSGNHPMNLFLDCWNNNLFYL